MNALIVSTSLNPASNSRTLAQTAHQLALKQNQSVKWLDLQETKLPICDGDTAYSDPNVKKVTTSIGDASAILLATPIYNYDANSAAKNLIELTGKAWEGKLVGFLCAAGGHSSYMSIMSLANSLMLDFRCVIVPRFVYATGEAISDGKISDSKIAQRVEQLTTEWLRMGNQLFPK